ncbi:MAG: restriction endonuclease subunit S [Clostridia bacterium]|nr:restriction endonuclease subunit S [Clostridia bacterium]
MVEHTALGSVIAPAKVDRCGKRVFPVLSMTMHDGIMLQSERFKKSLASIDQSDYKVVKRGQLVVGFPIDEGVLYVQKAADEGIMSPAYNVWDIDTKKIDSDFLELCLHSPQAMQFYKSKLRGTTARRRSIPTDELLSLKIPLPDLPTQRRIAATLDAVTALIAKRHRQLDALDQLVKVRFVEMFGLPGTDTYGWGMTALGRTCEINPKKSQDERLTTGMQVSFIPMPAVSEKGNIDATQIKTYDEVKNGFTYFAEDDVLFAKITPCMENGKGAVAKGLYNGIGFGSTEFHVLRPIEGKTNPYWIYALTTFPQFRIDAASNMTGSAGQQRVPASFLENYRISVPPLELQHQFASFVTQVDRSKAAVQQSLQFLETLKKSLMQQYFG